MDDATILARIDELLSLQAGPDDQTRATELYQGAIGMLALVHGAGCHQIRALDAQIAGIQKSKSSPYRIPMEIGDCSSGTLANLKREVEKGLVGNLRREVTGEVLGDLLQLAKATLDVGTEESKNVAAVLVAAAFEDTIRRLGLFYCGIQTREGLPEILLKLKNADILRGSQVGVVQAHFQFRNDAMHADWTKIDAVAVRTVFELVQSLLLKHFS